MFFKINLAQNIQAALKTLGQDLTNNEVLSMIEVPSNSEMGDFAFPCFKFAKALKKSPIVIANEIAALLKDIDFVENINVVSSYINFFIKKTIYVEQTLKEVLKKQYDFGKSLIGKDKTIVIDYSSPNIAKPFHIGHLRSTVIGNSLYKIFNTLGYNCIGINHLGDWGTQFGKLIVAYKKWGNEDILKKDDIKELSKIYVKFHEESEKDKNLEY